MDPALKLKNLVEFANQLTVDRNQPIRRYYRSGMEILKMGNTYYSEENFENAYILYLKYLTLFVEKIQNHPEYKQVSSQEKSRTSQNSKEVMKKSEKIKIILKAKYEKEYAEYLKQEQLRLEEEEEQRKLQEEEQERQIQAAIAKYQEEREQNLARQREFENTMYHQIQGDKEKEAEEKEMREIEEAIRENFRMNQETPAVDRSNKPSAPPGPMIPDRSKKPDNNNLGLFSVSQAGGLRQLIVPAMVMAKFLSLAQPNTEKNIETCAVLTGKLSQNVFRITHLLVPKQQGSSDSCQAFGEEDLFQYQEKYDLITLGWIHTHPSQNAFLSSVDLHTHHSYQLLLPEALAIVCAPKFDETGFFSLTQNHGLQFIGNCRGTGFHDHPKEPPLFEDGRHVKIDHNADVELVDLR